MADRNRKYGSITEAKPAASAKPAAVSAAAVPAITAALALPVPALKMVTQWLFYGSALALVLFLFLVFLHYTTTPIFSFGSNDDEGIISIPTASAAQNAFLSGPAASDRTANFTNILPFAASYAMTLRLDGTVIGTTPRVLFYRAAATTPTPPTATPESLSLAYPNSNVLLYLDPYVNDIHLMLKTATAAETTRVIKNAPIGTPFRVALVIQPKYVEVYFNGQLMETVLAPGGADLADIAPSMNVWGPPATTGISAKLAYLTYWPYVLSPKMVRLDAAQQRDTRILS